MHIFGIELAPLCIPLGQRIQTFAILYTECIFQVGVPSLFLFIGLCFTSYYWIPLLYLVWLFYDKETSDRGGRYSKWFRSWRIFKYYADYFPVRLIKTAELPPGKNYLLGAHPHGVICTGHFNAFATEGAGFSELFPGIEPHMLTLDLQYKFPFFRELFMLYGCSAATNENLDYLLSRRGGGYAPVLVVGGAAEVLHAIPGENTLVINSRKGFIKAALRNGADLVPVYSFGETNVLTQISGSPGSFLYRFQHMFKSLTGIFPAIVHGRGVFQYTFGIIPYRTPINIVVGKPIPVEKVEYPTDERVNELHATYLKSLKELFNTYKVKYNSNPNQELIYT